MKLEKLGLALVLAGFALAFAAALLAALSAAQGGAVGVGGCVLVLFIPVCFGAGPLAPHLLVAALALALALVVLSFLLWSARPRGFARAFPPPLAPPPPLQRGPRDVRFFIAPRSAPEHHPSSPLGALGARWARLGGWLKRRRAQAGRRVPLCPAAGSNCPRGRLTR
jgi:uncharacterized membrane protein